LQLRIPARRDIGAAARAWAREQLSVVKVASNYEDFYLRGTAAGTW